MTARAVWVRDPLLIFLLAGLVFYLMLARCAPAPTDDRLIVVDADRLSRYLAAGALPGVTRLEVLGPAGVSALIDRYVEEQALYREAMRLGLDDDLVLRRRLGQSLRFALADESPLRAPLEAELRAHFEGYRERFEMAPTVSFDHIYSRNGSAPQGVEPAANEETFPEAGWRARGDRFPYSRSYRSRTRAQVAAEFGADFADSVFLLAPGHAWQGPIQSRHGAHRVRLLEVTPASAPEFADVRDAVLDDWYRARRRARDRELVARVTQRYRVDVDPALAQP